MEVREMSVEDRVKRDLLRHTLATVAYRGGKAIRGAPAGFGDTRAGELTRTAAQILAHIGDLFEWSVWLAKGEHRWAGAKVGAWEQEEARFFDALGRFDELLAGDLPLACPAEKLFQGPIADALTHIGQLATLRRLAGSPVRGENYFVAHIDVGRVGREQSEPVKEFD
jgi:hypothetical protein